MSFLILCELNQHIPHLRLLAFGFFHHRRIFPKCTGLVLVSVTAALMMTHRSWFKENKTSSSVIERFWFWLSQSYYRSEDCEKRTQYVGTAVRIGHVSVVDVLTGESWHTAGETLKKLHIVDMVGQGDILDARVLAPTCVVLMKSFETGEDALSRKILAGTWRNS